MEIWGLKLRGRPCKMLGRNEDVNLLKLRFIFPNSSKRQTLVLGSDGRIIIFYFG